MRILFARLIPVCYLPTLLSIMVTDLPENYDVIASMNENGLKDRGNALHLLHDIMFRVDLAVIEKPHNVFDFDTRVLFTDFAVYYGDRLARGVS